MIPKKLQGGDYVQLKTGETLGPIAADGYSFFVETGSGRKAIMEHDVAMVVFRNDPGPGSLDWNAFRAMD